MPSQKGISESVEFSPIVSKISSVESEESKAPETRTRKREGVLSWNNIAWIMLSDIVGTSVLTFGGVAAQLGWVLTIFFIIVLFPLSVYVSVLMTETRTMLEAYEETMAEDDVQRPAPLSLGTMGDVAGAIFNKKARCITFFIVYGTNLLGTASYLLTLGNAIQMLVFDEPMCITTATAISCAVLMPFLFFIRNLTDSVWFCAANTLLIIIVVIMALSNVGDQGRSECAQTYAVTPGLTLYTMLGAVTNIVYAYAGQWIYFEMMDEMTTPSDFPKAFLITGPIMVTVYLVVASVAYYYGGTLARPDIVEGMTEGTELRIAACLLFLHVAIVYGIKCVVLVRFIHGVTCGDVNKRTPISYVKHAAWQSGMLAFSYVLSNAIPFFGLLLGLLGGLFGGPVSFLIPIFFYHATRVKTKRALQPDATWWAIVRQDKLGKLVMSAITSVLIIMTMIVGTYGVIKNISESIEKAGAPFACHPIELGDLNDCSP